MKRSLVLCTMAAVLFAFGGFSCEGGPAKPAIEYLPIEALH